MSYRLGITATCSVYPCCFAERRSAEMPALSAAEMPESGGVKSARCSSQSLAGSPSPRATGASTRSASSAASASLRKRAPQELEGDRGGGDPGGERDARGKETEPH